MVDGSHSIRQLGTYSSFLVDASQDMSLDAAVRAFKTGGFAPVIKPHFNAGYTMNPQWIAVPVENTSSTDVEYLVSTNIPFVPELSISLVRSGGRTEKLLEKTVSTPWQQSQFIGQSVVSHPFTLARGETAALMMRFVPFGIGVFPVSLETSDTASAAAAAQKFTITVFYSVAITSLVLFFLFVGAMRNAAGFVFLALFSAGLMIMAQLDGIFFRHAWPEWPEWNRVASFPMLLTQCATGAFCAAFMLRKANKLFFARLSRYLMAASLAPLTLWPIVSVPWLILIGFALLIIVMALITYAAVIWARLLPAKERVAFTFGLVMFIVVSVVLLDVLGGDGNLAVHNLLLVKILYVLISSFIMLSYATHIAALNQEHASSLARELSLAKNEAKISSELLASERRYAHAQNLIAHHKTRLADASHDLRQPLASLRLRLEAMARNSENSDDTVTRAVDYLDELVRSQIDEPQQELAAAEISSLDNKFEIVDASIITKTVVEMFEKEAAAKGLQLRYFDCGAQILVSPMPVMRIVSNLVSNAIKYTRTGGVLLASRRRGDVVSIEVIDTGPGMLETDLQQLSGRYRKSDTSQGSGLGLAICHDLAVQNHLELTTCSRPGAGTKFALSVPSASMSISRT